LGFLRGKDLRRYPCVLALHFYLLSLTCLIHAIYYQDLPDQRNHVLKIDPSGLDWVMVALIMIIESHEIIKSLILGIKSSHHN